MASNMMTMGWLLVLFFAVTVQGQGRVFTTCEAIADGLNSSVARVASPAVRAFCRAAEARIAPLFQDPEEETVSVDGEPTPVEDIPAEEGVALSTSSAGGVAFTVTGGDEDKTLSGAETGVSTRVSNVRPEGPWFTIVAVDVRSRVSRVWGELMESDTFFEIGLNGLGLISVRLNGKNVIVKLVGKRRIDFEEVERSDDDRFIVFKIAKVSKGVFPGFDFEDSRMYMQVLSRGFFTRSTNIELGWGPPPDLDIGGDLNTGVKLIESLLLEMLQNYEGEYGQRCEFGRNVRTVEGDCNNLDDPTRGSANEPLRRLGGTDPAYPDGDRTIPAGPLNINVRNVSNALFAMSPGQEILEEQAQDLRKECASTESSTGTKFDVCPFRFVRVTPRKGPEEIIPFKRIVFNDCEDLVFQFASRKCKIDVLLRCSGERSVELADDPCGAETNRLFDPVGCVLRPAADGVLANPQGLTDLFFSFGQFIDHDYGLSPLSQINPDQPSFSRLVREDVEDDFPITVPDDDFFFEREELEFTRARFSEQDPLSQVNLHSSYLDGSQIYGVDFRRARLLRSFEDGKLDLSRGNFPPFNGDEGPGSLGAFVDNAPNQATNFFVVGDARGNEQILLLAIHIAFLREHNLIAEELAQAFPLYDDELLYQTARAIVIAEYQCIVYNEWLPLLLGLTAPKANDFKYDEDVDATVSAIFTTSAFRFGHSMVGTNLLRMGPGPRKVAQMALIPIREAFFNPEAVVKSGVDVFLRGGAWHLCKELDNKVVDELRNFLITDFPESETNPPPFDLVSLNLQRGRDMGLPSFNDIRELFGLRRYTTFSEFVKDPNLADLAEQIYKDVDLVDVFFGGMVEEEIADGQLGETFNTIVAEQFTRSRDGDRFFYTGIEFEDELVASIPRVAAIVKDEVRLRDIILRNTRIKERELGNRPSVFQI